MHVVVRDKLLRHRGLRGIVGRAERDVVHRAAPRAPAREIARLAQIDEGAHRRIAAIARERALARDFAEAEHIGEDRGGRLRVVDQQRHAMEAADRVLGGNVAAPGLSRSRRPARRPSAKRMPSASRNVEHAFAEALLQRMRHALLDEAVRPVADRGRRNAERGLLRLADAEVARRGMLPGKEGQDGAGLALLVAIIKVIGARIVEIHGLLDQPQPERAGVEVQIAVGAARNGRDVMDAGHGPLPVTGTLYWAAPAARQTLQSSLAPRQRWAARDHANKLVRSGRDPAAGGAARLFNRRLRRGDAPRARDRADPARARASAPRMPGCCCARTSSCCTRPGCFASISRRSSAAWSSNSSRSSTFRPRSRAAVPRPPGMSAISPRHHWMLGYYEPETQHEVWDANPDALIASSIALAAGRGRKVDGGFEVTGRWPFSSGVDNSDWNMLAVTVYDGDKAVDWRLCLVPKTDYEIIDTWYAMGMSGTGSKDIAVKALFVPERRALALASTPRRLRRIRAPRSIAARCSASRSSAQPASRSRPPRSARRKAPTSISSKRCASAPAPIRARRSRTSRRCRSSSRRARVLIDSGRALSRNASIALQEMSARGEIPDIATKLRWRAQSAFAVNQAREAVETLWSCYGAQGLYTRDPLAAASARRDRDEPALLVQLRHRGRGLRPARARRQLRQSGDVIRA